MLSTQEKRIQPRRSRSGFTLVEMLVAVALVLLMMTMFAEIFTLATGSMSKQKGLAELDQRHRMASMLIREDIKERSFRRIYPNTAAAYANQEGYFYISENDPENDSDDILQFTIRRTDPSKDPFFGLTRELIDSAGNGVSAYPNQPENDDGTYFGDNYGVGTAKTAEVSYFLRNGILYRRVLLVRDPLAITGSEDDPTTSATPVPLPLCQSGIYPVKSGMGSYIYVRNGAVTDRFPRDFDYSATYDTAGGANVVKFLGQKSLRNDEIANSYVLGRPMMRFGFRPDNGRPVEYLPNGDPIGRFTHEETSHPAFAWPGDPGWGADGTLGTGDDTNPYTRPAGLAVGPSGSVTAYAGGTRQGEDILLTNVQSFDVKVWDALASLGPDFLPGIGGYDDDGQNGVDDPGELGWPRSDDGAFTDIGHSGTGYFSQFPNNGMLGNSNSAYGPFAAGNRCFDTWHPALYAMGAPYGQAPFHPALPGPDGAPGQINVDDDNDGTTDNSSELGWAGTDDIQIHLTAIQLKIRYRDVSSGLIRDLTLVEFLDN